MFFYGPIHMDVPALAKQQELCADTGCSLENQQDLCADTGCSLENLLGTIDDRDGWRERERKREGAA